MARLFAWGALLARAAASENDATVLVQQQFGTVRAHSEGPLGGYAFEKFQPGEKVEGLTKTGTWIPVAVTAAKTGNVFDIHVLDEFPGYDLPDVPGSLLRRTLSHGLSDYYVDNSALQHKGKGVLYRHSKDMHNKSAEYAPWSTLVVGKDEGDGWLKVSAGYLPMEVHGAKVLKQRERKGYVSPVNMQFLRLERLGTDAIQEKEEGPHPATLAPLAIETYERGEHVQYRTRRGIWFDALVMDNLGDDIYNVVLKKDGFTVYPVQGCHASKLRKVRGVHGEKEESPICQKEGCIGITARSNEGDEMKLHIARSMKVEMVMKMACNRAHLTWEQCLLRATFFHGDSQLSPELKVQETDLQENDVVDFNLAPAAAAK